MIIESWPSGKDFFTLCAASYSLQISRFLFANLWHCMIIINWYILERISSKIKDINLIGILIEAIKSRQHSMQSIYHAKHFNHKNYKSNHEEDRSRIQYNSKMSWDEVFQMQPSPKPIIWRNKLMLNIYAPCTRAVEQNIYKLWYC